MDKRSKSYTNNFKMLILEESFENLKIGIYDYIEMWYNEKKIRSKLAFIIPNDYERFIMKGEDISA